jgi:hypothetical protein
VIIDGTRPDAFRPDAPAVDAFSRALGILKNNFAE